MDFEISSETVDIDGDFEPEAIFKKIEAHMTWPYFQNAPAQPADARNIRFEGHENATNVNWHTAHLKAAGRQGGVGKKSTKSVRVKVQDPKHGLKDCVQYALRVTTTIPK